MSRSHSTASNHANLHFLCTPFYKLVKRLYYLLKNKSRNIQLSSFCLFCSCLLCLKHKKRIILFRVYVNIFFCFFVSLCIFLLYFTKQDCCFCAFRMFSFLFRPSDYCFFIIAVTLSLVQSIFSLICCLFSDYFYFLILFFFLVLFYPLYFNIFI